MLARALVPSKDENEPRRINTVLDVYTGPELTEMLNSMQGAATKQARGGQATCDMRHPILQLLSELIHSALLGGTAKHMPALLFCQPLELPYLEMLQRSRHVICT
eukprot:363670-Chlamydomonas_euryale.AAC.11